MDRKILDNGQRMSGNGFSYPAIRVRDLRKKYDNVTAVDNISFEVARGEIFAYLGPNGAGKTTTIKMLTSLLRPTSGVIEFDGLDLADSGPAARKRLGIVFQDPSHDEQLTASENMELYGVLYGVPRKQRKERIEILLKAFDLWDRRGYATKTFSGGMRRRLEIARGLIHTPQVLFLDEPTIGLDPQTRSHLWEQVKRLNEIEHVTVFMTTHYMDEAERVAHRIAIIDHGKIVAEGTPAGLREQTNSESLEQAFIAVTGAGMRPEQATTAEAMRRMAQMGRRT